MILMIDQFELCGLIYRNVFIHLKGCQLEVGGLERVHCFGLGYRV